MPVSAIRLSDSVWTIMVTFAISEPIHATSETFMAFVRALQVWRSLVPVMTLRVIQTGVPIDRLWRFAFDVKDGREYSIDLLIPLEGQPKIRPVTEEFWLRSEIAAIFPVVTLAVDLIQAHTAEKIAVEWR